MKRQVGIATLAAVSLLLLVPFAAQARVKTKATVFRAFRANGKPAIANRTKHGSCYTGSLTIDRNDAWRCQAGNFLYDPCFSSPKARGVVLCPGVQLRFAVKIRLTKGLPRAYADHGRPSLSDQPWNLQLMDGEHCGFSSGATSVVQGKRLNYFCSSSGQTGLWGYPNRHTHPWSILSGPFTAKSLHQHRLIRHAWM